MSDDLDAVLNEIRAGIRRAHARRDDEVVDVLLDLLARFAPADEVARRR
jgi:hypothetical protein